MLKQSSRFSPDYLQQRRRELMELQNRLRHTAAGAESEETALRGDAASQSREYEEEAQRLEQLRADNAVVGGLIVRLARVQRALEKIDEGTYGLSDVSGEPIPEGRLQAMPEAVNTVAEQSRVESAD